VVGNAVIFGLSQHPECCSTTVWWSTGGGVMLPVMFAGIEAKFNGFQSFSASPGITTDDSTLALRQVNEMDFVIVK
jgi:hypothetical protein